MWSEAARVETRAARCSSFDRAQTGQVGQSAPVTVENGKGTKVLEFVTSEKRSRPIAAVSALGVAAIVIALTVLSARQQKAPQPPGATSATASVADADAAAPDNRAAAAARERLMDGRNSTRLPTEFVGAHESNRQSVITCRDEQQCPRGTICHLVDGEVGCYASNCKGARDTCGEGKDCIMVPGVGGTLWRCVTAGSAALGENCMAGTRPPREQRCIQGLRCWGGRCRALCDASGACRSGSCIKTLDEDSVCADDSCKTNEDCPGEHVCMPNRQQPSLKTCRKMTSWPDGTRSCLPGRCSAGMTCDGTFIGNAFRGKCRPMCSVIPELRCPEGYVCGRAGFLGYSDAPSVCYRRCDVFDPMKASCDSGEKCRTTTEQMDTGESGCAPDYPKASFAADPEMDSIYGSPVAMPGDSSSKPPAEKDGS